MKSLADTSFTYALFDPRDKAHQQARAYYLNPRADMLIPSVTLGELAFLLNREGGTPALIRAMRTIKSSKMQLLELIPADYYSATDILERYADSRIDFVDACIMALAERLKITRILTFDRRDFGLYRPAHCEYFDLLP